ncbi:hypothetical protein PPACK8108_LOCUS24577 [Phakopsora pachyrhizi]|uniref:Uncharacterized protein n=1 Tax=Phakopsora pachyrhizi TaxID=170000 RepID=A0AAV0BV72_PHAPC|nr:hypothetical protein PPACK8108_LOCUS24577 [Phakopsora pachyrhizi]
MILKEENITSQGRREVSKHGLVNIDLSQFAPIVTVDSSLTGTERLGTKLQKSRIEKAKFLLNASKINANSQFSNYLNIPSNNTLGHLPRKPGPSLTTKTNKRGSSIVTGVLSPSANQSTLSPNSIGFGKKSPQLFGRAGLTDINPTPNLGSGGITNNNILVHLILLLSERLWWKIKNMGLAR